MTQKFAAAGVSNANNATPAPGAMGADGPDGGNQAPRNADPFNRGKPLSLVGPSLTIKGEIEASEDLIIQGRVEGSVKHTADRLVIGKQGVVHADIHARNLSVEGVVEGNIVGSESVVIQDTAKVRGNISTPRLSIADGAHFVGGIDMDVPGDSKR
jgi:cytoskeletal protein CcmA (bactofilin family)